MRRAKKATSMAPRTPKSVKIILVKWLDATHQEDETEPIGSMLAWTVGFQIYRNKKEVAFCMEVFENGNKRDITTVPMINVKSIKTLVTIPFTVNAE